MDVTAWQPVGAKLTGLAVDEVNAGTVDVLRQLLAEHGVLVLPGQSVDDAAFVTFLRSFGDLQFTDGETPVDGFPDLNVVSNVGRAAPPRSQFHVDTSYVRNPPAYTALRAVQVPSQGGATQFTNQYRAFETLPHDVRERLHGRTVTHVVTGVEPGEEASAEHPVFRRHPITGRTSLYLSTPQRCAAMSGLDAVETERTIAYLLEHSTRADNILRHAWSPGDIVMWDNACVLHKADHAGVVGDRVMHRGMVAG